MKNHVPGIVGNSVIACFGLETKGPNTALKKLGWVSWLPADPCNSFNDGRLWELSG